jgi:hypothetical protein
LRALIATLILAGSAAGAQAPGTAVPAGAQLEAGGAVIRDIHFRIHNIFNPEDPHENKAIFRLANRLHIKTRESTVQARLLFKSGEKYSQRLIDETERHLRALDYLYDAEIFAVAYEAPYVDLVVVTRDVWTLQPGASYDRKGGENSSEFEIEEENLLGRGKNLAFSRIRDVERTSLLMQWSDPNIFGTRWRDELEYASNDDGHYQRVLAERPFYSLDARWSAGLVVKDGVRVDPRYDLGELLDEFRHDESVFDVYGGFSRGLRNGWTRRWLGGWRYHHNRFELAPDAENAPVDLPPDRKLSYPWVGVQWIEDRYESTTNLNQINRTEDLYYGRSIRLDLGWASKSWGSDRDALMISSQAQQGFKFTEAQSLFLGAQASGRLESGDLVNASFGGVARYYWRWAPKRVFSMTLDAEATELLDPEKQVLLGGDTGLRGYPLRYQTGTSRALFSMEQRFFTDWFPFRLFHVGAAVFFDVGRTWGVPAVGSESLGLLKDVGLGLRLGNARSAFGSVLHFDVAYPLDRVGDIDDIQFLVETKRSF